MAYVPSQFSLIHMNPLLVKYVPTWFPGAGFHRLAAGWRKDLFNMADIAHNFTKDQMASTFFPFFHTKG